MAETRTIKVQVEGLEELQALVREMRRAAEAMEKAARMAQDASRSATRQATGGVVLRRLCDPEAGR
jgi:hypothetical protein